MFEFWCLRHKRSYWSQVRRCRGSISSQAGEGICMDSFFCKSFFLFIPSHPKKSLQWSSPRWGKLASDQPSMINTHQQRCRHGPCLFQRLSETAHKGCWNDLRNECSPDHQQSHGCCEASTRKFLMNVTSSSSNLEEILMNRSSLGLTIDEGVFEVKATSGDIHLVGEYFKNHLTHHPRVQA